MSQVGNRVCRVTDGEHAGPAGLAIGIDLCQTNFVHLAKRRREIRGSPPFHGDPGGITAVSYLIQTDSIPDAYTGNDV